MMDAKGITFVDREICKRRFEDKYTEWIRYKYKDTIA